MYFFTIFSEICKQHLTKLLTAVSWALRLGRMCQFCVWLPLTGTFGSTIWTCKYLLLDFSSFFCISYSKNMFFDFISSPSSCHPPPVFCRLREARVLSSLWCCVVYCWVQDLMLTVSVDTPLKRCVCLISPDRSVPCWSLQYRYLLTDSKPYNWVHLL